MIELNTNITFTIVLVTPKAMKKAKQQALSIHKN